MLNIISYARKQGYFSSPAAIKNSDGKVIVLQFGMEAYDINWTTIENQNTDLEWIFENAGAFTNQYTIGAYGWLSPKDPLQEGYEGLDYTQYFLKIASENQSKKNWASTWKGFNDVVASWAPPGGRHIQQLCGKTWMDSWGAVRAYTDRLDAVQVVTWHDYEEGTEIQSGIDNCLSISASVSGNMLSWSVPSESTLDHYTVYISADGVNLMSLGDFYLGTDMLDLSQFDFAPGSYQVFVQAIGAPSVKNQMSPAAVYTVNGASADRDHQHALQRPACRPGDQSAGAGLEPQRQDHRVPDLSRRNAGADAEGSAVIPGVGLDLDGSSSLPGQGRGRERISGAAPRFGTIAPTDRVKLILGCWPIAGLKQRSPAGFSRGHQPMTRAAETLLVPQNSAAAFWLSSRAQWDARVIEPVLGSAAPKCQRFGFLSGHDFSVCVRTDFRFRQCSATAENQAPQARNIIAQHVAEGGVLGEREKQPESPGDDTVLTQTLQSCR